MALPVKRSTPRVAMRASDADRDHITGILAAATAEGRLDIAEFEDRLGVALSARTHDELADLVADLPPPGSPVRPDTPAPHHRASSAVMAAVERQGVWEVGPTHSARAWCGEVVVDLREARFTSAETVLTANALWGEITIIVNPTTRVVVEGTGFMGEFRQARDRTRAELTPDSPLLRVRGRAVMASVTVVRRDVPGRSRRRRWFGRSAA